LHVPAEESAATVGREPELARLDAALEALPSGPACLVVEGEPGIGKTHLLAELARRAELRGCVVLSGSATEFERDLPFSVWTDALDAYVASRELELEEMWPDELVDELAGIVPSARRGRTATHPTVADERYRAHRATRALLELLAATQPLVVVLDDLHWSDEASVELLAALIRRPPDVAVLLALGFRPGLARPRLAAALASPAVQRLALQPLTEGQARALLGAIEPDAATAIYRHGGGNPFYLRQLLKARDEGRLTTAEGVDVALAGVPIPAAVAAALADELLSLPGREQSMLRAAAVAGEPFDPGLASAIAELSRADGLGALDELLALDLVRPTTEPRRFVFRHPLVRHAVYDAAPAGWRLAAHERAAAALAASGAPASERAMHVDRYATRGDEEAVSTLLDAGHAAASRAPAAAARWFGSALRLLPEADARAVDVRVDLASSLRSLGELDRCRLALLDAIDALPADAVSLRVELTAHCAAVEHWLGRHDEAHRRLSRVRQDLPPGPSAEAAVLEIELAVDGLYERDFEHAIAMGREALSTAHSVGDRALVASAAAALCLSETVAGEISAARGHREEAVAAVELLSDAELAPRLEALYHLAWAETYLELYEEAYAHIDRGVEVARAHGQGRLLVSLLLAKNFPFEMQGRLHEATEICETAVEAARLSASPHELYRALFELGWTRYYAGDLDAAIAAHEESSRVDPRLAGGTIPNGGGGPGWGLGVSWLEAGEVERGRALLLELGTDDAVRTMPVERCFDWESLTIASLAAGDAEAAARYALRGEEDAAELDLRLPAALASRARAAVLLAEGEPVEAAATAAESAVAATAAGARLQAAFSRGLQGQALAAAGERSPAIAILREAERELDACGSLRVRDEMRRELRRLGARSEPRGPAAAGDSGVGALTKRELQIAGLVTDRLTNREIAAALFLSDKTVESHIRNIFHKLGVASRVDVARAVEHERRVLAGPSA